VKSLLASTSARDLRWATFPWLALLGTILAFVAIGLFLQRLEVDHPIAKMRAELRALIRVDGAKLDDHKYGGGFGGIARDVNAALEHVAHGGHGHDGPSHGDAPPPGSAFGGESHFDQAARPMAGPPLIPGLGGPPPAPAEASPPVFSPPSSYAPPAFAPPPPPSFAAPATAAVEDEDSHVRDVYQQFLAMKEQCGEPTAGLTLEKFSARLRDNRAALMAKHECRTVRFSVYVKDGKASLRATPIK